jgi:hypothetical protein
MHEQGRSPVPGRARFGHAALMSLPKKWRTNVKYIFLAAVFTLATIASANADTTCVDVRELTQNGPGKVTDKLKNGYTVTMRDFYLLKGQSWTRVVDGKTQRRVVGWVFKDYLNCNSQAVAAPSPVTSPAPTRKGSSVYLKKSGVWTTYTDVSPKGEKILGMYTIIGGNAGFYVKYFGGDYLVVQMFKKGWQFPSGGVDVSFSIQFDDGGSYPGTGNALMDDAGKSNDPLALVEAPIRDPEVAANTESLKL